MRGNSRSLPDIRNNLPLAPVIDQVTDRVHDLTAVVCLRAATSWHLTRRHRQERRDEPPLRTGGVRRIPMHPHRPSMRAATATYKQSRPPYFCSSKPFGEPATVTGRANGYRPRTQNPGLETGTKFGRADYRSFRTRRGDCVAPQRPPHGVIRIGSSIVSRKM